MGVLVYKPFDFAGENHLYLAISKKVMQQKIFCALVVFVLAAFSVFAAETPRPGITPDNAILWKLDVLSESFLTAITLDQQEKVQKLLHSAEERLTEMAKMLRKDKRWAAEKALQQQTDALEEVHNDILYLDHSKTETLFENVFFIESQLQEYAMVVQEVQTQLSDTAFEAEEQLFINQTFVALEGQQEELARELQKKKEETILKLRANGLSDEEIITLEASLLNKIQGYENNSVSSQFATITAQGETVFDTLFENQTTTQDLMNEAEDVVSNVVSDLQEYIIDSETEKAVALQIPLADTTVITDTSFKSKVKVEGTITAAQQILVDEIYDTLKNDKTKAEVEIEVVEIQEGMWRIEKEVDGILSSEQQGMLNDLLISLSKESAQVRIKIKHDPAAFFQ